MDFLHFDLGQLNRGDVVEVTLRGNAANVRLLDSSNFSSYRHGSQHRYYGGLAQRSPVCIEVPLSGRWYVAVDMQGLGGSTNAAARVIRGQALRPLPPIREQRSDLAEIAANVAELPPHQGLEERDFDVFISHAAEDKDAVVRPLALSLQQRGLSVWYDEFELRVGDSLRRKIDSGIARSRFGIVVSSHTRSSQRVGPNTNSTGWSLWRSAVNR